MEKKQLRLNNFCKEYDIPRSTALRWISENRGFPAYNLCGRWYIDLNEYYEWRKK